MAEECSHCVSCTETTCLKLSLPNGELWIYLSFALISQDFMRLHHTPMQFPDTDENAFTRQKPFWRGALNDPNIRRQKLSDPSGLISKALNMNPASIHIDYMLADG